MVQFLKTLDGRLLNALHIQRLEKSGESWSARTRDGSQFRVSDSEVRRLSQPRLPARPDDTAFLFSFIGGKAGSDFHLVQVPIVGWTVDDEGAQPILPGELAPNQVMAIYCR